MGKLPNFASILLCMLLPVFANALFEYICDEKQLYKPYLHVYKSRKGARVLEVGPGFHDVAEFMNVYVCINGPAYLYFSKTSELGEVYEAPQLKKYAHTCEMYNVQPREGSASVTEVQLHLRAVLLLGDPVDYRRLSIQKFTAPYFFRKDQLNPRLPTDPDYVPMPPHYINATSLVIIGQSECTLSKGNKDTIIKIRPHIFPVAPPAPDQEHIKVAYLCKIGYKSLLDRATAAAGATPENGARASSLALINDQAIRVEKCESPQIFDLSAAAQDYEVLNKDFDSIDQEFVKNKTDLETTFKGLVDAVVTPLTEEKTKLETKMKDPETKSKEVKKLEKQIKKLELRLKIEEDKKVLYSSTLETLVTEHTACKTFIDDAKSDATKSTTAKTDKDAAQEKKTALDKVVGNNKNPIPQSEIDLKKKEFDEADTKATNSIREYQWALTDLKICILRLKKTVETVKRLGVYAPSSANPRSPSKSSSFGKSAVKFNPEGTMPIVITAKEEDCEPLPILEGEEGECKKGKPHKNHTCDLFQTTLGVNDPWEATPRTDVWKRGIMELIGDIFSVACDRIPNVKKFVRLNNRAMSHYLTNKDVFGMKPNYQTDTCINFKFSKNLSVLGAAGLSVSNTEMDFMEEKPFWNTIKLALKECKMEGRRLSFRDISPAAGKYKFVKDPGSENETEHDIFHLQEQADEEYSYNWPIDMNWKMFVTVMGLCMSGYEKKIPLITSRFFSLYTEYFLIPLRETWVNPKDNMMFQFIMGEFYNGDAELWADNCMESSFVYAGQRDYRPPRSVLVNCASEHNYFINGEFTQKVSKG